MKIRRVRSVISIFLVAALAIGPILSVPMASASVIVPDNFAVYSDYTPGTSLYGIDGYGDLLYYDDGTGMCHIVNVGIAEGSDSDRTFDEIATYDFETDSGWTGSNKAEFYVDADYIYYGNGSGIEQWAKNEDGTFGQYLGRLDIPAYNKGETLGYDAVNDTWYTATSNRVIYSYQVGVDTKWQKEFTYPAYGLGTGHHGGLEYVGGSLVVSEVKTDIIGQWEYTGTGAYNGWEEVNRYQYYKTQNVQGLGFGPQGHFWASSGSWKVNQTEPSAYEIGGSTALEANFTWSADQQKEGYQIDFVDTSTAWPDEISSWSWDFGDGNVSNEQNPSHTYGDEAVYIVSLTITTLNGYEDTIGKVLIIGNDAPVIDAVLDTTGDEGNVLSLFAAATDPGTDDLTFTWDWGDGTADTVNTYYNDGAGADPYPSPWGKYPYSAPDTAEHTYGDDGIYNVVLTVTDDDGLSVTSPPITVSVNNLVPTVQSDTIYSGDEGSAITLFAIAEDAGTDDLTFTWIWGDDTADTVTTYYNDGTAPDPAQSPWGTYPYRAVDTVEHTYGDDGEYEVTITVEDDDGDIWVDTATVIVDNVAPAVDAGIDIVVAEGETVYFEGSYADPGWLDTYNAEINWGDGTEEALTVDDYTVSGSHDYAHKGVYVVTLTVTDDDGGRGKDTLAVYCPLGMIVTVAPGTVPADWGAQYIPLQDIPLQDITLEDLPLQDIPLQDISLNSTSLQDITIAGTPLQDIPLQDIPLQDIPLQDIPLQDIPLQDIDMVNILLGTPLQDIEIDGIPLQDIPLQDIPLQDITLYDLVLNDVPLRYIALGSTPLQDIPLQDIPLQDITWESIVLGTPLQGIPLQDISIFDLAMASIPLQDITIDDIPLQDIPLQDIPLQDIELWHTYLEGTPLQDIPLQDIKIGDLVLAAAPLQDITLNGTPLQDIPLQDITIDGIPLQDIPLQDILLGIPLQDIPLQDIPLQDIMINGTPLQDIMIYDNPLQDIPLQDIPLQDITWESILFDTPLQDIPLQDITIGQLVLSGIPLQDIDMYDIALSQAPLQDITIGQLPLQDIPLQDISLMDIFLWASPLQDIPLQDIPLQDITVDGTPLQDITLINILLDTPLQDIPLQDITLYDLEVKDVPLRYIALNSTPLQDIPLQDIEIYDNPLQDILLGTPLQDIPLQDISIFDLAMASVPLQDILLVDLPLQDIPLQDIPLQDIPLQDITLAGTPFEGIPLQDITLGELALAAAPLQDIYISGIPLQDIPLQDIPLQDILLSIPLQDIPLQDITVDGIPLQDIEISGTPLQDILIYGNPLQDIPLQDIPLQDITWESILFDTPLQDIPLQDITIADVILNGIPLQDISIYDIVLGQAPLQDIALGQLPLQYIPLQDIEIEGTPLQDIPLQDIPLQDIALIDILLGTPLQDIEIDGVPLQDIPLQDIPLQDITLEDLMLYGVPYSFVAPQSTPLQDIPLQDIPLQDITWESLLIDTPLQDIPLQDISIFDLAMASIPLQDITIDDVPLQDIPLQDIPLQDIAWQSIIMGTPLQDIPLQDIRLGDLALAAAPLQDISITGTPLQDIPLQDIPLQDILLSIPLQDIPLQDIIIDGIPLQDIGIHGSPLQDIEIDGVPLQDIPLQDIPLQDITWESILAEVSFGGTLLQDIPLQDITIGQLILNGIPLQDITLHDIVMGQTPLQDITLYDILIALIPLQNIPWESLPLQDILLQDSYTALNTVTYTITIANYDDEDANDVVINYVLPDGFSYVEGSTTGATSDDPAIDGQQLTWSSLAVPSGTQMVIDFDAVACTTLGTYISNATADATLTIPGAIDTALVTVADTYEDNDTWEQAYEIGNDNLYVSYISSETDVDWYKMAVPADRWSMINVYLSHLPADYDLAVFASVEQLPSDIPLQDIPLQDIPLQDIPLQDIPLQDIPLMGVSMARGTDDELVGDKVINEVGYYYIMVAGYDGAHSDEPYVLRVGIDEPPTIDPFSRDLPAAGQAGDLYEPYGADSETLILTNEQRLHQYYSVYDEVTGTYTVTSEVDALMAQMQTFASLDSVKGMIVPVDYYSAVRDAYAAWDVETHDPEVANAVTAAIREVINDILASHPNVKYLVIAGTDEIIPFRRVPDEVYLSNESTYADQAHLEPSALYASLLLGYVLTDDYYADVAPISWMGRQLYIPDYAIGRLVETPDEIASMLSQYVTNDGELVVETALVTGYDFLSDGAQAIADALQAQGVAVDDIAILINDEWTAEDLANLLLTSPSYDLNSINAHFNHWATGPAVGEPFYSDQILASSLEGKLVFSMGCHSGLSVDDSVSEPGDSALDFPQVFSQRSAWYVGNTGYGYGDSDIVALSEELMRNFAWALGDGESAAVGQALVAAKQQYFLSMGTYGAFDEKILIESTLYGLPMYNVVLTPGDVAGAIGIPLTIKANQIVDSELLNVITDDFVLIKNSTSSNGTYYSANGETQYAPYKPVQPRATMPISVDGAIAHGVLFTGGEYFDIEGFDPLIGRPVDVLSVEEPQLGDLAWYPSNLQSIVSLQIPTGTLQSLIVMPGQFIATETDPSVIGTQRLFTSMSYDIYYTTSADSVAPVIDLVDIDIDGVDGNYTASFNVIVSDANDPAIPDDGVVSRVVIAWTYSDGTSGWETVDLTYDAISGAWQGELAGLTSADADFVAQAVDSAGNVGVNTQKGLFYTPIQVEAGADQTVDEGTAVAFSGSAGAAAESIDILWDFGDGSTASGMLNPTHVYADNGVYTATLTISDGKGGAGSDTLTVTVDNVAPAVDVPETITTQYSDPLELTGSFTDAGTKDVHTYKWDIVIDSETTITVWGNTDYIINWLEWLADYPAPGTYPATLTATDDDGGVGIGYTSIVIVKEDTVLTSPVGSIVYSDDTTISVGMLDDDASTLLHQADAPKTVYLEYYNGTQWVVIAQDQLAAIDNTDSVLDIYFTIPANLDVPAGIYDLRVRYDGDMYYNPTEAAGSLTVVKETIEIMVGQASGLPYDTVAIDVAVVDNDGELLIPGPYVFGGTVDGQSIGDAGIDQNGNLQLEYVIDIIPVDLTVAYAITISIAENGYYGGPDGAGTLTIYSPLYLQTKILSDLENLKTGGKKTDPEIDRDIARINQTLEVIWLDASRIHHVQGKEVFQDNSAVVASLLKINDNQLDLALRDSIIYDLTKSSEILARVIVDKALALTADDPDALPQMSAAVDELAQGQALAATCPAAAIGCYMRAWESAQQVGQLLGVEL
ncbi:PKD domain-containing protein [Chloroflexota bacterium]